MSDERIPPGWTHDGEWLHVVMPIEPSHDKRRPPDPTLATPAEGRFIEHPFGGKHQCPLPPQWSMGALWQCPEGHLWVVASDTPTALGLSWWPASWRQRRKYGPGMKRATLDMADPRLRHESSRAFRERVGRLPSASPRPPLSPSLPPGTPPTDFDG